MTVSTLMKGLVLVYALLREFTTATLLDYSFTGSQIQQYICNRVDASLMKKLMDGNLFRRFDAPNQEQLYIFEYPRNALYATTGYTVPGDLHPGANWNFDRSQSGTSYVRHGFFNILWPNTAPFEGDILATARWQKNRICPMSYSLLICMAHIEKDINTVNRLCYINNRDDLKSEAKVLCEIAGIDLTNGGGILEIRKFQEFFLENHYKYRIVVFSDRQ
jgi:hypothetical protein